MKNTIVLENIRSCYNVGNIIRTADALWRDVILVWYTPSPTSQPKVKKTSLGAEEAVNLKEFFTIEAAIEYLRIQWYGIVAAEVTPDAIELDTYQTKKPLHVAVIFGNEVTWVEPETLQKVDAVIKVPMVWEKESLNVGQTAAIFMWSLR